MLPCFFLSVGLCVATAVPALVAKEEMPPCAVMVEKVEEREDMEGNQFIAGSFRISAPQGYWLPEPSYVVWRKDLSRRCLWQDRFQVRWIFRDHEGREAADEVAMKQRVRPMLHYESVISDDEELPDDEELQEMKPVTGEEIPELVVKGQVFAPPRLWEDGKLNGEVKLMIAPRSFRKCEASPAWRPSAIGVPVKNEVAPACEMHAFYGTEEMRKFVEGWLSPMSYGHWAGDDGSGVFQSVCFMPDYKPREGDVYYKVVFTARDKVFRNVTLVPEDGDASAVRLIGFSMMELGVSTRGQWEESYLFVMPREDGKARVKWEEQRVQEVRVPVLLDMADVSWRRK